MKKLQPVFDLINTILLQQLQIGLSSAGDQSLGLQASIDQILLKTEAAEGLSLEQIQVKVERLQLPYPADLNLYATILLENLDLNIAPAFWGRAAKTAKNPIVGKLGILLDRVEVRNLRIEVKLSPTKIADILVSLESCRIRLVGQLMQETTTLKLEVYNFDLRQKDKKKALADATIRLQDARIRVLEMMMNRVIEVVREKIPSKVSGIDIALIDSTMRLDLKLKLGPLPMQVPVEVQLSTRDNQFGIYIVKIFVGMARPIILKAIQTFAAGRREISASGDNIWINPWGKIPVKPELKVERFAIESGALLIQFGTLPEARPKALPAPAESIDPEEPTEEEMAELAG
ncbi:MAG: hypothetical protein KF760_13520 [Candidatus Eremiobacteraeota bacterium]|nr:hypothetical protein [Candidatus Eremiobacteraeota bacterium]MCW5867813.1 hypothetical protein [Candidatus Eremiobacteraeota bacterium]